MMNSTPNMLAGLLTSGVQPTQKNIFSSTSYYESIGGGLSLRPATATPSYPSDNLFVSTPQVAQMSNLLASNIMSSRWADEERYNSRDLYSQQLEDYELARNEIRKRFESEMASHSGNLGYSYPDYSGVEYNLSRNSRNPSRTY